MEKLFVIVEKLSVIVEELSVIVEKPSVIVEKLFVIVEKLFVIVEKPSVIDAARFFHDQKPRRRCPRLAAAAEDTRLGTREAKRSAGYCGPYKTVLGRGLVERKVLLECATVDALGNGS